MIALDRKRGKDARPMRNRAGGAGLNRGRAQNCCRRNCSGSPLASNGERKRRIPQPRLSKDEKLLVQRLPVPLKTIITDVQEYRQELTQWLSKPNDQKIMTLSAEDLGEGVSILKKEVVWLNEMVAKVADRKKRVIEQVLQTRRKEEVCHRFSNNYYGLSDMIQRAKLKESNTKLKAELLTVKEDAAKVAADLARAKEEVDVSISPLSYKSAD